MESKNVKVIDEHGIDRDANIICGFKLDGKDYVLYWIERDNENDNLFVSKLLNNNDGTSNMLNIEDTIEKGRIVDITKQLITYAIKNESDKADNNVTLGDVHVEIFSVKFNKDQNINVSKTYVTTVKKAVTKVGEKFYHKENELVSESLFNDNFGLSNDHEAVFESNSVGTQNNEALDFMNNVLSGANPMESSNNVAADSLASKIVSSNVDNGTSSLNMSDADVESKLPNNVDLSFGVVPNVSSNVISDSSMQTVISEPAVSTTNSSSISRLSPVNNDNLSDYKLVEEKRDNVIPSDTDLTRSLSQSSTTNNDILNPVDSGLKPLVFDGAKETNLNIALDEASNENNSNVTAVDNIDSLRQFGQNDNSTNNVNQNVLSNSLDSVTNNTMTSNVDNNSGGFANKKFFVVVAILLFVAACCFLGYEVYKYFQLTA